MKKLLLKRGCNPEAKDRGGVRAMDLESGTKKIGGSPKIEIGGDGADKKKKKKKKKKAA